MSRIRGTTHHRWLRTSAVLAVLMLGCGDTPAGETSFEDSGGMGGANAPDGFAGESGAGGAGGAAVPSADGGVSGFESNPVEMLLANPERNPFDFLGTDTQGGSDYAAAAALCYSVDEACAGPDCSAFASCCLDSGQCCGPKTGDASVPALLDFVSCQGQTLEGCVEGTGFGASTFGPLEPKLTSRGLVPNGTASSEGGGVIGAPVDLASEQVRLEFRFALPIGCSGSCLESAGVAFTGSEPGVFVEADLGLLLSGSRELVSLMVGGAVLDSFDAGSGSTVWSLLVSPSGSVEVERNGVSQGTYAFDSASLSEAKLVVFGRNLLPDANSAAIARVSVETLVCDNPSAWTGRGPMSVTLQGTPSPAHAGARKPSIAEHQGETLVAFELDGEIFVATREAPFELDLSDGAPALVATEDYEAMGLGDPELVSGGTFLALAYTARDSSGSGSIRAALYSEELSLFVKTDAAILVPNAEVVSFDAPSLVLRDGLWLMVVRASLSSGATELRAYYASELEGVWERIVDGGLEPLTRVEDATQEISDPSLLVHNSAYHLYYGRRSGTRWTVELAVSDEMLLWRALGKSLGASGAGFDSLGARSPDAISGVDQIDLVYSGQNGVSFQIGTAKRAAPSDTASSIF